MNIFEAFDNLNKLNEDDYSWRSAQRFWDYAKNNVLAVDEFHQEYDKILSKFGLTALFDEKGMLKNKGTYGEIKKALEDRAAANDPDSTLWALRALLKFWLLQFKSGAKNLEDVKAEHERAEADRARKREKEERNANEIAILKKKQPEVESVVNKAAETTLEKYGDEWNDLVSRITKYEADPIIQANWYIKSSVPFDKNKCEIKVLAPGAAATLRPCIYISINGLPGKRGDFSLELYADDVQSANLEDRLTKWVEKGIASVFEPELKLLAEKLAGYEKYYNKVSERENEAKAAQAAIDADKPEDPDFIPKLLAAMKQGIKHAEDEMRDWSSVQDGSDGAAYETAIREAAEDLDEWLKHVNWRAYSGNREIASWRIGDGMDKLKTETIKALNSYNPELSIEILKSR